MLVKKMMQTLLAGSLLISSFGCTAEQLTVAANLANQLLKELESGNKVSIDLALVNENGVSNSVSAADIDEVRIGGRRVRHSFNAQGELVVDDFNLSDGGQAEAEVQLKGYQRPVIVVINPEQQKRSNIRLHAEVTVATANNRKVVLDQVATTNRIENKDSIQSFQRNAVVVDLGAKAAQKLNGKQIAGVWLDGDRLPQNQLRVNQRGQVLVHSSAFLRYFMGLDAQGNFVKANDNLGTVSFRNKTAYKQLKDNLRKKVLREKSKYVQTRTVTETRVVVTKKIVTQTRFVTQQVIGPAPQPTMSLDARLNLQLFLNRLNTQQRADIEARAKAQRLQAQQRQELERRLAELKQRQAELQARRPVANVQTVQVGNQQLERRQLAGIRGLAATKLARDSKVYKNRTLYVLTRTESGKMQLYKFLISGKQIERIAQTLTQRLAMAKQRAEQARLRLNQTRGGNIDDLLNQVAADVDTLGDLNAEGDLLCEAQVEDLENNSDNLALDVDSAQSAEQMVMTEEISAELSEELADVLVDATGSTQDDVEVALQVSDIEQAASESNVSAQPEEVLLTEDQINLESEIQEANQTAQEVQQSIEEEIAVEILAQESQQDA